MSNGPIPLKPLVETPAFVVALVSCLALAAAIGAGRFALTPILPMMRAEGLITVAEGGWITSVHSVGYAMGAFAIRYVPGSPQMIICLSLACVGATTGAMGLVSDLTSWSILRWIAGLCSAFVFVEVSAHGIRYLADARRQDLQGLVFSGVGVGIGLIGILSLLAMVVNLSSSPAWVIVGALVLIAAVVVGTVGIPDHEPIAPKPVAGNVYRTALNWRIILPYGAMGLGYIIPATYLPIMAQMASPSPLLFGMCWPVFGAAAALSTLGAAWAAGRFPNRRIWIACQSVMAAGLLLPVISDHLAAVIAAGICVGGTFMVITMAGMKEAHQYSGHASPGVQIAAMTGAFAIGQILGPVIAGWLFELTNSFAAPLILASAFLALTLGFLRGGSAASVPVDRDQRT